MFYLEKHIGGIEMTNLPIYMHSLLTEERKLEILNEPINNPFVGEVSGTSEYYGPSARYFFNVIIEHLGLTRNDEIAIITTSNDTYVSICVTIPCFNYCRISRVVTNDTKLIIVIHEYGYVMDDLKNRIDEWKSRGIVVIEDCAHLAGVYISSTNMVGTLGDYSIYSLSKIIPGVAGGLLKTKEKISLPKMSLNEIEMTELGRNAAEIFLPRQQWFNRRRMEKYNYIKSIQGVECYDSSYTFCPYFIGIIMEEEKKKNIEEKLVNYIEFGATLNPQKLFLPTNPLISLEEFTLIGDKVVEMLT